MVPSSQALPGFRIAAHHLCAQLCGDITTRKENSKRTIAGVPSGWALPGFPITAHHLCAFLLNLEGQLCGSITKEIKERKIVSKNNYPNSSIPALSTYKFITSKQHSCVQGPLRECCLIRSGASGLPYYCTPFVCVPDVLGRLAVWQHNDPKKKCTFVRTAGRATRPEWMFFRGFYFESRARGKIRISRFYNNTQINKRV